MLGCCYNGDHGFARDPAKAVKWWRMAAAKGVADAQFCLGLSCFLGDGTAKDLVEAAKWWKLAADQDHPDAQYFLGLSYHTGFGVPKSRQLAIYWLRKSADHGSKPAGSSCGKSGCDDRSAGGLTRARRFSGRSSPRGMPSTGSGRRRP